ncbi:MAG: TIGR00730 family Rossman fold protein [Proteobacteria bacterium]|nr:TIGR00730 family Rossman fold protein [Pseudomonadota bacterium]
MSPVKNVCVYCGASSAADEVYKKAARDTGRALASAGVRMVYGGGKSGLMGIAADAALAAGGKVTGIFPKFLEKFEPAHDGLTDHQIVDTMHERKQRMAKLADAFVVLPGGFGTLDEFFEILTWRQLKLHEKPVIVVNIENYWGPLLQAIDGIIEKKFARPAHRECFVVVNSVTDLMALLQYTESREAAGLAQI